MKRLLSLWLALLLTLCAGCAAKAPPNRVFGPEDVAGKAVGVLADSAAESYALLAGASCVQYTDWKTLAADLMSGELDCAVADEETASKILSGSKKTAALEEPLADETFCLVVALENPKLTEDLNGAIEALKADGSLKSALAAADTGEAAPEVSAPDGGGSLIVAVDPTFPPYCFTDENGELTGSDIWIARAVCARLGLTPSFLTAERGQFLSLVQSGRAAFAIGRIAEDEEAAAAFSVPYTETRQVILVRK
ncbi:MAG: transporter substrate-binding domain-containing protein [Oscillospiraceae bacterium]|nr:transporter substrate-binding domain-containing protein [Oscillospiraceae bacterium]